MERLTYKNYIEEYEVNFEKNSDKQWSIAESDTHIKVTGEPINKLGELEDVLEEFNIDDTEDLKNHLLFRINYVNSKKFADLVYKIKDLEQELTELKQNTSNCRECKHLNKKIELNIKNKLMLENNQLEEELADLKRKAIIPKFQVGQDAFLIIDGVVKETNISSITIFVGNELSYYCKYVDNERMYLELNEEEIFATREEAEKKLAEIKER